MTNQKNTTMNKIQKQKIRQKLKKINQAIVHSLHLILHRDGDEFQYLRFLDCKTGEWIGDSFPLCHLEQKKLKNWVECATEARQWLVDNYAAKI